MGGSHTTADYSYKPDGSDILQTLHEFREFPPGSAYFLCTQAVLTAVEFRDACVVNASSPTHITWHQPKGESLE